MILVSPAEPTLLRSLGTSSLLTEKCGADFLWTAGNSTVGVQRKTPNDFLTSLYDGRLAEGLTLLRALSIPILLIEGRWDFNRDGLLMGPRQFRRSALWGLLMSIQRSGVCVLATESLAETADLVVYLEQWSRKEKHTGLLSAPSVRAGWNGSGGKAGDVDRKAWALQIMCPGIGVEMSRRIIDANGGKLPADWTEDQFRELNGIGPKRAKELVKAFR